MAKPVGFRQWVHKAIPDPRQQHGSNHRCARKEEKILPTPVVKQALEAKILSLKPNRAAS